MRISCALFGFPQLSLESAASVLSTVGYRYADLATWNDGIIDFPAIIRKLRESGYDGFLCVDYVWGPWQDENRVDVLSEGILMRDLPRETLAGLGYADVC